MEGSAVIKIDEFDTSPQQAIRSILENHQYFKDVHLVKHGYSSHESLYPGFQEDLEKLRQAGLPVTWHSELDPPVLVTKAAISLPPDVRVTDGALSTLQQDMLKHGANCDHFAVSSVTYIELDEGDERNPRVWLEALSYGFLLVILMLDTFRSIVSLFQYHRTVDLRADFLTVTYPNRTRIAPDRWWRWWIGTGICYARRAGAACMQLPDPKDQGLKFVLRTIKTHRAMGIGGWILGFLFYYAFFSWPWWNNLIDPHSRLGSWICRDMTALYWQIPYLLHTAVVGWMAWQYFEFPLKMLPLQVLLYTFYLTLSPIIFFYGRFHSSRAAWVTAVTSNKKRK